MVRVSDGTTVLAAVRAHDGILADRIARGEGYCTDGRGIAVALDAPIRAGGIIRAVISARRASETDSHS